MMSALLSSYGGDDRIRTGDGGFADLCLTTWPRRHWLVPRRGFEPLRPKARPPQDRVSTYSTTSAGRCAFEAVVQTSAVSKWPCQTTKTPCWRAIWSLGREDVRIGRMVQVRRAHAFARQAQVRHALIVQEQRVAAREDDQVAQR